MTASYWYGQIRPANFAALRSHYRRDPPWPMSGSPHVDLVRAVIAGEDPAAASYARYIAHHGASAGEDLAERVRVVRSLLEASALDVRVEAGCVLDGNHRWAVAHVTGIPLASAPTSRAPYQTVEWPDGSVVAGRRLGGPRIPDELDLRGAVVLELGSAQGAMSIEACRRGATRVYAVDRDRTSLAWSLRAAWGLEERVEMVSAEIDDLAPGVFPDVTVVFALSVYAYFRPGTLARLTGGRQCLLECHGDDDPPDTGHRWRRVGSVPYSRARPEHRRAVHLGCPR